MRKRKSIWLKKIINIFSGITIKNRVILGVGLSLIIILGFICLIPFSFAQVLPVKSIELFSKNLSYQDKEAGAWKVTKSAKWTSKGEAEIKFDVDSILKLEDSSSNILLVLNTPASMNEQLLGILKKDLVALIEKLLSNGDNKIGLISFDTSSKIISDFTNDKEVLINKVNNLSNRGLTNYYNALVSVDELLKRNNKIQKCLTLFLVASSPNVNTPNEIEQYNYLKSQYPRLKLNALQYEMGRGVLDTTRNVSDEQFVANMDNLGDVLFDATVLPIVYDNFKITDYIDTNNFSLADEGDVTVTRGNVKFDKENQKVDWIIKDYKSGSKAAMSLKVKLKDSILSTNGIYSTNKEEIITSDINGINENVFSDKTPIIADNYKVMYDLNTPDGCSISDMPEEKSYSVFDKVKIIEKELPVCAGYKFKGWKIISTDVVRLNNDYFIMPEKNIVIRAEWAKMSVIKSMIGKVYEHEPPVLQKVANWYYNGEIWKYKENITKVIFQNEMNSVATAIEEYDISEAKDGSVKGYIVPNGDSTYTAYIKGEGNIFANQNSSYLFAAFTNLQTIEGLNFLDTSRVTNMSNMFNGCKNLKSLDLSSFDTRKVTNMKIMFDDCEKLASLNISSFNTSNVTDMNYMFYNCSSLTSLNVSHFDTSKVTNMQNMFHFCRLLTRLDVSNFNTSRVTNMWCMFNNCDKLLSLDLSNFNTSKVTDMSFMFHKCSSLKSLNISSFNTSNVVNMKAMFYDCSSLTGLDVSRFNTSKVTDISIMFDECRGLTSLNVSNFDTHNVTDMSFVFYNCCSLKSLNVRNFNTSKVTNMYAMFALCTGLTSLDLSNFDTSKVTTMMSMFNGSSNLTNLNISNFNTSNVTDISFMFHKCNSLTTTINISGTNIITYEAAFWEAATVSGARIVVNYTNGNSSLVNNLIATKASNSNVVKGTVVSSSNVNNAVKSTSSFNDTIYKFRNTNFDTKEVGNLSQLLLYL